MMDFKVEFTILDMMEALIQVISKLQFTTFKPEETMSLKDMLWTKQAKDQQVQV